MRRNRFAAYLGICVIAFCAAAGCQMIDGKRTPVGRFEFAKGDHTVTLAKGGQPQIVIVVPDGAPPPVRFAGEELKEHLDRMTGGSFRIVKQLPADGKAIVLGDCPGARKAGIDVKSIGRDGYAIRTVGNTIYIAGKDDATKKSEILFGVKKPLPRNGSRYNMVEVVGAAAWDFERGTLYGAYRFLEELGVRWFFAGEKGRIVPPKKDVTVQAFSLHEEPFYILRKVGTDTWQWYRLKSSRLHGLLDIEEYEDLNWDGNALRLWLLRVRHSSEWFAFNHRPPRMDLEERYGKEHPEYFAVRENGERDLKPQPGRTGHLGYTHPGVLDITKTDINAYFAGKTAKEMGFTEHRIRLGVGNRGWPISAIYGRSISLLPHDSFRGCECPNCLRITHKDKDRPHWHSELVWQFIVKAAKWLEQAHPGKFIICLAYSSYSEKPEGLTSLPENVVVGMCPANYARTSNDVAEESYQDLFRMVKEWSGMNKRPMLIWLHHLYRHRNPRRRGMPMLLTRLYGRMFRDLADHANLMHVEVDADSITLEHLNRYVMLRLLYNPNLDSEAIVDDYAKTFYGPGGKLVREMLRDIEDRCRQVAITKANSIDFWEKHFSEEVMQGYRRQTDEMLRLVKGTPHEEAGRVFSRWFIGAMEKGRSLYVRNVKQVAEQKVANVSIRSLVGKITIDGELNEEGWKKSSVRSFISNIDGKPTKYKTEVRFLRAPEHLYFAFACHDPNTMKLSGKQGERDSVEIFLDPEHDHDSYYFIQIDIAGDITMDWYFEGGGEPPDKTWKSNAKAAVKRTDKLWIVEIELPRKNIKGGLHRPMGRPWGANFCRSMVHPPRLEDQFSCWSPLLRGKFHQPDLFAHIFFIK